jgi:hypothetical protein
LANKQQRRQSFVSQMLHLISRWAALATHNQEVMPSANHTRPLRSGNILHFSTTCSSSNNMQPLAQPLLLPLG